MAPLLLSLVVIGPQWRFPSDSGLSEFFPGFVGITGVPYSQLHTSTLRPPSPAVDIPVLCMVFFLSHSSLWGTPGDAQGFFLTLQSGITPLVLGIT